MNRKVLVLSVVAVVSVVVVVAFSAVTAFALIRDSQAQPVQVEHEVIELAPHKVVEPVNGAAPAKPVLRYNHAGHDGKAGCNYSAKQQLTEAPSQTVDPRLLTLADQQ